MKLSLPLLPKLLMNKSYFILLLLVLTACLRSSDRNGDDSIDDTQQPTEVGCPGGSYPDWDTSYYVLPYPVGKAYPVNLSHCTSSYHAQGQPDQYAIDFDMPIGTRITVARDGSVVHVEETGHDGGFPNNLVVIKHFDNTYALYMHLTFEGAAVAVGDEVLQGDTLGFSGSTGLAGYPHLHFIVTQGDWQYPYTGVPYNFKNTDPNPRSLEMGKTYPAYPY